MSKNTVNAAEFFSNYMFHSFEPELSKKEKIWITITTAALGIFTLGICHIITAIVFYEKKFSILDRYNNEGLLKRINFLSSRLKNDPENEVIKQTTREVLEKGVNHLIKEEDCQKKERELKELNEAFDKLKENLTGQEDALKRVIRGLDLEETIHSCKEREENRKATPENRKKWHGELDAIMDKIGNEVFNSSQILQTIKLIKQYNADDNDQTQQDIKDFLLAVEKHLHEDDKEKRLKGLQKALEVENAIRNHKSNREKPNYTPEQLQVSREHLGNLVRKIASESLNVNEILQAIEFIELIFEDPAKSEHHSSFLKKAESMAKTKDSLNGYLLANLHHNITNGNLIEAQKSLEKLGNTSKTIDALLNNKELRKIMKESEVTDKNMIEAFQAISDAQDDEAETISDLMKMAKEAFRENQGMKHYLFAHINHSINDKKFTEAKELLEKYGEMKLTEEEAKKANEFKLIIGCLLTK